ncbi:aminoglycoside phosphotransferase family protein [Sphaerotilus mobilis]|uniref:Phosphotransferase family enzyme n=1 Tax=Sphaerotilus mobilis TaxID=47994 RepID=A0A4Q7LRQ4_9BURK|nr:aminoglycoside phosphotransferase family protein [Sphaerotilus mobilis]RZS56837.1 phosphotransferase family enzyme [Sphaerotilus mobilis]
MNIPWSHRDGDDPDAPPPTDFPQRRWCFGSDWLDSGLAASLGWPATPAEVENVYYLPGRQLQVVYRLACAPGGRVTLLFATPGAEPLTAEPARWLPQARAQAWLWPDDPAGLPLARWLSPDLARLALPETLPRHARLRASLLSYAPGERLALRWQLDPQRPDAPLSADADASAGWVMKAQRQGVAHATALRRLWQQPGRRWQMAEPLVAEPLMAEPLNAKPLIADPLQSEPSALRWERFLPGIRLEDAARDRGWDAVLQQAATALVDLHRQPLDGLEMLPRQSGAQVHRRLDHKVMKRIRAALPGLSDRAQALADRLGRCVPERGDRPAALLHGDLHTGNLLLRPDGGVAFIDLDSLMVGDPAWDMALLSTRLMLIGLLDPAQAAGLAGPLAAWPQTCIAAGGDPDLLPSYRWHVATLLLSRQVKTCVRHHAPGMTRLASALLAQAEAICPDAP